MQLTDKQVQQFHEEGYLIFENLIHGEKLKAYQELSMISLSAASPSQLISHTGPLNSAKTTNRFRGFYTKFRACASLSRRFWTSPKKRKSLTESKHSSVPTLMYSAPSSFPSCRMAAPQ